MIILNNRPEKDAGLILVPVLFENGQTEKHLKLLPGNNYVTTEDWEKAKKHCEELLKNKTLQEITSNAGGEKKYIQSISDLKPDRAKEIINECFNLETLNKWYVEETRGDVRNAVDDRIHFIDKDNNNTILKRNRKG